MSNMQQKLKAVAEYIPYTDSFALYFWRSMGIDRVARVKDIVFEEYDPMSKYMLNDLQESALQLDWEAAQKLMDSLWTAGIRPTDQRDRAEVVNAKEAHIKDLRAVLEAYIKQNEVKK